MTATDKPLEKIKMTYRAKPNKTMCRRCNSLTKNFRKINKIKIPLCSESCSIEYVLRRFLNTRYDHCNHNGTLSITTY